ncbi:dTMP kinase [Fundicoccus ignavus]|uniref:Thymidylate kinase n=1 Tax=Fundicoccus ignavus TaxID=2664442 RepID=A0A6I2GCI6_9LACT|nr:dTMP kinase [Fundicoccus ignavus]MRI81648.1 dTMP kinase [Fundicoccus ignavus]MRI84314.1 dTMP kinase [Fundicoccus ignavus]MRJ46937.1 dTMP kinase [Fundicoccus ignavus]
MTYGKFISIEGPDGAGKTSVVKALVAKLEADGITDFMTTREPGGIKISEQIRNVILDVENTEMDARTEALLFAAARRQHLVEKILPALEAGKLVICDRFVDSSLAYQGVARNIPTDLIWEINQFAIDNHLPDLTILIDVPAEIGLERINQAKGQRQYDRLDREGVSFHNLVRDAFLSFEASSDRIVLVDGTQTIDEITEKIYHILKEKQMI